jgi:hypothetical protein
MNKRGRIKTGWANAGKELTILGEGIVVNGRCWVPIVFDDEGDPEFHKCESVEVIETMSSEDWYQRIYPKKEVDILDPDGWDRVNFDYSWKEEQISEYEFNRRVMASTCKVIRKPVKP